MKNRIIVFFVLLLLGGCSMWQKTSTTEKDSYYVSLNFRSLASEKGSEFSSMCWVKSDLLLVPQYPSYFRSKMNKDIMFYIPKEKISQGIKSSGNERIVPTIVELNNNYTYKLLDGYEGFEGVCYDGKYLYFTVEYNADCGKAVVVKGEISEKDQSITLIDDAYVIVDLPANVSNAAYESISVVGDFLYIIYEANGRKVNPHPIAKKIAKDFSTVEDIIMDHIEYRITDVSSFNSDGEGWAINNHWAGDIKRYDPEEDKIINPYSEYNNAKVGLERIIPIKIKNTEIIFDSSRNVTYMKREHLNYSNNWEGLVKIDNIGFLVVTDKYPDTRLRFYPAKFK